MEVGTAKDGLMEGPGPTAKSQGWARKNEQPEKERESQEFAEKITEIRMDGGAQNEVADSNHRFGNN